MRMSHAPETVRKLGCSVTAAMLLAGAVMLAGPVAAQSTQGAAREATREATRGATQTAAKTVAGDPAASAAAANGHGEFSKQARLFRHPKRGFSVPVPPETAVLNRGEEMHLSIRSLNGFIVNVQTGDANPAVPLNRMVQRLETQYLKPEGPWSVKLDEAETEVKGLAAYTARYDGNNSRTQVLIARGQKTDFVFMFISPRDNFQSDSVYFTWMLENFTPAKAEGTTVLAKAEAAPPPSPAPGVRAGEEVAGLASDRAAPKPPVPEPTTKRFNDPGLGYVMDYPKEWVVDRPRSHTALFSGAEGTPAYDAVVSVQNVEPKSAASATDAAEAAAKDLKQALTSQAHGLSFLGEGKLKESPGSQFIASYDFSGQRYRKWAVIVPRPDGKVAHIWSFTAPEAAFEQYRIVAEAMLRSWTLTN